jgi:hypothetical protein
VLAWSGERRGATAQQLKLQGPGGTTTVSSMREGKEERRLEARRKVMTYDMTMWGGGGEENECGAQLIVKERENDVVSSPHGSIQIETRRKSVEQQAIRRWLRSTNKAAKE